MSRFQLVAAMLLAAALAGCGSEEAAAPDTTETTTLEDRDVDTSRCLDVAPLVVSAIEEGLTVSGGGSLRFAQAVRSNDFERAHFVAADIQGAGLEGPNDIGLWVTNRIDDYGNILAVDGTANEFSDWGDGTKTDARFSQFDDGAAEARDCTKTRAGQ